MHPIFRYLSVLLTIATVGTAGLSGSPLADFEKQIQDSSLDFSHAVGLTNLNVELGGGVLEVEQGMLLPGRPIAGRAVELVFVGKALFRLTPPDEIEAYQMETFTQ